MKMKKKELVTSVAEASGRSKVEVRAVFSATVDAVRDALSRGEEVFLFGLGKLSVSSRGERPARNLHTGERVMVPPRKVALFHASDSVLAATNGRAA